MNGWASVFYKQTLRPIIDNATCNNFCCSFDIKKVSKLRWLACQGLSNHIFCWVTIRGFEIWYYMEQSIHAVYEWLQKRANRVMDAPTEKNNISSEILSIIVRNGSYWITQASAETQTKTIDLSMLYHKWNLDATRVEGGSQPTNFISCKWQKKSCCTCIFA